MEHPRINEIDEYWRDRLGCNIDDLRRVGTTIHVRKDEKNVNYILLFRTKSASIVKVNPQHLSTVTRAFEGISQTAYLTAAQLQSLLKGLSIKIRVPEYAYYLGLDNFQPVKSAHVRQLNASDRESLENLQNACTSKETELGEVEIHHPAIFGCFVDNQLVAAASLIFDGEIIADVGALTHPNFRGCGFGKTVVTALCQWGLEQHRILQYWTMHSNVNSMKLALSLGFSKYATEELLYLV